MLTLSDVRQQALDLVKSGDPERSIVVVTTPERLAILTISLRDYIDLLVQHKSAETTIMMLREFSDDVQKVVTQILQQEFPPT